MFYDLLQLFLNNIHRLFHRIHDVSMPRLLWMLCCYENILFAEFVAFASLSVLNYDVLSTHLGIANLESFTIQQIEQSKFWWNFEQTEKHLKRMMEIEIKT